MEQCPSADARQTDDAGQGRTLHQTLVRFIDANRAATVEQLRRSIRRFRVQYNSRRPDQSLNDATPTQAWNLVEHTPATEPIPMAVLEAKAREYLQAPLQRQNQLNRAGLTITKNGHVLPDTASDGQRSDQSVVTVMRANRQLYYHGYHVSLPSTFADRQFYRTITDETFLLTDMGTGEIVFSFPLPMVALGVRGRFISSYAIRGVQVANPTKQWRRKYEQYVEEFASRGEDMPDVFMFR